MVRRGTRDLGDDSEQCLSAPIGVPQELEQSQSRLTGEIDRDPRAHYVSAFPDLTPGSDWSELHLGRERCDRRRPSFERPDQRTSSR